MSQMTRITTTSETNLDAAKLLAGAAAGALLMYLLDPDRGGARRARSVAAVRGIGARASATLSGTVSETLGNAWHEASERASSLAGSLPEQARKATDSASSWADKAGADGAASRVGSALSRLGKAAGDVLDDTLARAKDLGGRAGHASGKFGDETQDAIEHARDSARRAARGAERLAEGGWGGAKRNTALAAGGLLAVTGLLRRSPLGLVLGLAGAALLARSVANKPLRSVLSGRGLGAPLQQTIDVEKSIHIDAAPQQVYDLWANVEHFPRFMSNVIEVRDLGRRRSHWIVRGPGGSEFSWNAVMTEQSRPHRLAWRSEPGAEIPQSGSVQLNASRGGTDVVVRMSYTPPAGMLGHGLATLLGADPKARMDEDLARMKAYIERGVAPRAPAESRSSGRFLH